MFSHVNGEGEQRSEKAAMTEDGGEKLAVVATRDKEATVVVGRGFCPRKNLRESALGETKHQWGNNTRMMRDKKIHQLSYVRSQLFPSVPRVAAKSKLNLSMRRSSSHTNHVKSLGETASVTVVEIERESDHTPERIRDIMIEIADVHQKKQYRTRNNKSTYTTGNLGSTETPWDGMALWPPSLPPGCGVGVRVSPDAADVGGLARTQADDETGSSDATLAQDALRRTHTATPSFHSCTG